MSSRQEKANAEILESASQAEKVVNGVNITALFQTVEAVKVNPVIAKFRFNVKNEWLDGPTTARLSTNFTEPRRISSAHSRSTSMPTSTRSFWAATRVPTPGNICCKPWPRV